MDFKALGRSSSGGISIPVEASDHLVVPNYVKTGAGIALGLQAGSGTITLHSDVSVGAGKVLSCGTGANINLPNNGASAFQIEGVSVGTTVTAANLDTLTDGSNADALHTHAGLSDVLSFTSIWGSPASGEIGYVDGTNTAAKAVATSMAAARAVGSYQGTANTLSAARVQSLQFITGLTLNAGDPVYVSKTAGRVTNDVSAYVAGDVEYLLGFVKDPTAYVGSQKADVVWQPGQPIQL